MVEVQEASNSVCGETEALTAQQFHTCIVSNLTVFRGQTSRLPEILISLVANGIFHHTEKEHIENNLAFTTSHAKCNQMYTLLLRKDPNCHDTVLEILVATGNGHLVTYIGGQKAKQAHNFIFNGIWFAVRECVDSFTGREAELKILHDYMTCSDSEELQPDIDNVQSRMTTVVGLGGVGKSEFARRYARKFYDFYAGNCVWINAETSKSITDSFLSLAKTKLKISLLDTASKERQITEIMDEIYEYFKGRKCLFIFDNAEEYVGRNGIVKFLPRSLAPGTIRTFYFLVTTRMEGFVQNVRVLELGVLTEEEAVQFVHKKLGTANIENIKKLCGKLQRLPLALQQAVAYMVDRRTRTNKLTKFRKAQSQPFDPVDEYLTLLEVKGQDILDFKFYNRTGDTYELTVLLTWRISLDKIQLEKHGEQAIKILNTSAYLLPDYIFIDEMKLLFVSEEDYNIEGWFEDAILLLSKYSMATVAEGSMKIHRLVQQVVRISIQADEEYLLTKTLHLLQQNGIWHFQNIAESIWMHCLRHEGIVKEFYELGLEICKSMVFSDFLDATASLERTLGADHESINEVKLQLGISLSSMDRDAESCRILEELYPVAMRMTIPSDVVMLPENDMIPKRSFPERVVEIYLSVLESIKAFERIVTVCDEISKQIVEHGVKYHIIGQYYLDKRKANALLAIGSNQSDGIAADLSALQNAVSLYKSFLLGKSLEEISRPIQKTVWITNNIKCAVIYLMMEQFDDYFEITKTLLNAIEKDPSRSNL